MEVVAEYEYEALHGDELTLRPGDIIKNVRYIEEDGWMEGELNGKRGLFPDNFVKEMKKESKEVKETKTEPKEETSQPQRREKSAGNVANLVQRMSTIGIPTGGFQPQPPAAAKKPKRRQCKVLFEYQPQNEDELELKVGDVVDINEEIEEGWWSGSLKGKSGLFPSNFVKELDSTEGEAETNDVAADETDAGGVESSTSPTSPQPAQGNGVAQPKKIRGIGFGDIFKEGSVKLKVRLPSPEREEKKDRLSHSFTTNTASYTHLHSSHSTTCCMPSHSLLHRPISSLPSAAKPAHPNTTESQRSDRDDRSKAKEYCKVTFAFEATNEDELTIKEGDIIHVLSKDTGEPGWWRGEIGGREGVFPDNFIVMLSEAEKETLTSRGSVKSSPKQESEEKPKKPPPPFKSIAPKPEVSSADRRLHPSRPEDKVDKPTLDHRPSKPAAPMVPPKKPVPPPGKGRPGVLPPKRPDKPLAPSQSLKHNGEVPSTRSKSDLEPSLPAKPKTLSGDWGEKSSEMDLMSFDELSSTSEKLSHPTANRPKMPGRRLPAQFGGGHSPNKEVSVEKSFKIDEEETTKPKPTETRKPSIIVEAKPSSTSAISSVSVSQDSSAHPEPNSSNSQMDELRSQMKDLLMTVELLKTQQMKEIAGLREELDEERQKRVTLQMEIEKLKRSIHST